MTPDELIREARKAVDRLETITVAGVAYEPLPCAQVASLLHKLADALEVALAQLAESQARVAKLEPWRPHNPNEQS